MLLGVGSGHRRSGRERTSRRPSGPTTGRRAGAGGGGRRREAEGGTGPLIGAGQNRSTGRGGGTSPTDGAQLAVASADPYLHFDLDPVLVDRRDGLDDAPELEGFEDLDGVDEFDPQPAAGEEVRSEEPREQTRDQSALLLTLHDGDPEPAGACHGEIAVDVAHVLAGPGEDRGLLLRDRHVRDGQGCARPQRGGADDGGRQGLVVRAVDPAGTALDGGLAAAGDVAGAGAQDLDPPVAQDAAPVGTG